MIGASEKLLRTKEYCVVLKCLVVLQWMTLVFFPINKTWGIERRHYPKRVFYILENDLKLQQLHTNALEISIEKQGK
jgi:hypothetical protein